MSRTGVTSEGSRPGPNATPAAGISPLAVSENRQGLVSVLEQALARAARAGADSAEAAASRHLGLSATVRLGEVERVTHHRHQGLAMTVYLGGRKGSASTNDFRAEAVAETVDAACRMARCTADDPCAGLADAALMARDMPDLDLYHPWHLEPHRAIELAQECETAARDTDSAIRNSEGASLSGAQRFFAYANSHGFVGYRPSTRYTLSCTVIADDGGGMQRDYWYSTSRVGDAVERPAAVGRRAAQRALSRLGARQLTTRRAPVLFAADMARSLLGHFVSAISGGSLYRSASFLKNCLGKPLFPSSIRIFEDPLLVRGLGSAAFDAEGVTTQARDVVVDGVLEGYVLDSYSARKLKMNTTANAGGVHNLTLAPGGEDLAVLMRHMDTGLLVTELLGMGVNGVTGDYSRGVAGFWIERGQIQYPVEEVTIAGNLRDMFMNIVAVGSDLDERANVRCGSVLIGEMTIAGKG